MHRPELWLTGSYLWSTCTLGYSEQLKSLKLQPLVPNGTVLPYLTISLISFLLRIERACHLHIYSSHIGLRINKCQLPLLFWQQFINFIISHTDFQFSRQQKTRRYNTVLSRTNPALGENHKSNSLTLVYAPASKNNDAHALTLEQYAQS